MTLEGKHLGRYQIVRLLGSGSMVEVYLAEDPHIHQQVALNTTSTPAGGGTVTPILRAEGVWAWQVSASQQRVWAQLNACKSTSSAQQVLASQTGIAQVSIQISVGNRRVLPSDPSNITIVVQAVLGV